MAFDFRVTPKQLSALSACSPSKTRFTRALATYLESQKCTTFTNYASTLPFIHEEKCIQLVKYSLATNTSSQHEFTLATLTLHQSVTIYI